MIIKRFAVRLALLLCILGLAPTIFAQAVKASAKTPAKKDAAPATPATTTAPASPELIKARMRRPVKGTAYIEIIKGVSKKVGNDIVTVTRVKNISDAPIVGLRIDEWWYAGKEQVSGGDFRARQPIAPGEIVDAKTVSPWKPGLTGSQLQFTHANGGVKPTTVKKFGEPKK